MTIYGLTHSAFKTWRDALRWHAFKVRARQAAKAAIREDRAAAEAKRKEDALYLHTYLKRPGEYDDVEDALFMGPEPDEYWREREWAEERGLLR